MFFVVIIGGPVIFYFCCSHLKPNSEETIVVFCTGERERFLCVCMYVWGSGYKKQIYGVLQRLLWLAIIVWYRIQSVQVHHIQLVERRILTKSTSSTTTSSNEIVLI